MVKEKRNSQGKLLQARGMWVSPSEVFTAEQAREWVRPYRQANINMVLMAPNDAALPLLLPEAHAQGIEVHATFWGMENVPPGARSRKGQIGPAAYLFVSDTACPSSPEVRKTNIGKMVSFVERYPDVDGIRIDWIGFCSDNLHGPWWLSYCYCHRCRAGFQEKYGLDPIEIARDSERWPGAKESWYRYRCDLVNDYLREIKQAVHQVKPSLVFSAMSHMTTGISEQVTEPYVCSPHFQEWGRWMAEGIVDFFCPTAHTSDNASLRQEVKVIAGAEARAQGKSFAYPGLGLPYQTDEAHFLQQIQIVLDAGLSGFTLLRGELLVTRGWLGAFAHVFAEPAVPPHASRERVR